MQYYEFKCGCKLPVLSTKPLRLDFNPNNIRLDCPKTWDMICDGNVKGVFQLESQLGHSLSKRFKPRNIYDLAVLISIMRPACLEAMSEGKSLTNHYIDRKHGLEETTYLHPALEPILQNTYGILVFQEQAMKIAQELAGFNLQEADSLRRAAGKKLADEMAKVKQMFLTKGKELGKANEKELEEIFGWIEKSQRYSFNASHGVSYSYYGYISAYTKAHFIRPFFTSWLYWAKEKIKPQEEVHDLVNNAKLMDIEVCPPDFRRMNENFALIDKKIYFGLTNIKGIGTSVVHKMIEHIGLVASKLGPQENWTWIDFLLHYSQSVTSVAVRAIISSGGLDYLNVSRTRMMYEYDLYSQLTDKEQQWCLAFHTKTPIKSLNEIFTVMVSLPSGRAGAVSNKKRLETVAGLLSSLKNPPHTLEDSAEWTAAMEEFLLGIPLTCSKVDGCNKESANCNCREFLSNDKKYVLLAVQVDKVKEHTIKNGNSEGKKMAFLGLSDGTCAIDAFAFNDAWDEYKNVLTTGNTVMVAGERSSKDKNNLQIKKVWQI